MGVRVGFLVALAIWGSLAMLGHAQIISLNFSENSGNQGFAGGQNIGPLGTDSANWNTSNGVNNGTNPNGSGTLAEGTLTTLIDSSGNTVAGASVTWSSSNAWYNGDGTATDEAKLAVGYLDDGDSIGGVNDGTGVTITFTGIPYSDYKVYGLLTSDQGDEYLTRDFTVNGVEVFGAATTAPAYGSTNQSLSVTGQRWSLANGTTRGNYWTIDTTGSTLTITAPPRNGAERGSITGVVIRDNTAVIFDRALRVSIDRDTGNATLTNNTGAPVSIAGLGFLSDSGAWNAPAWRSITSDYDQGAGVSNDSWLEISRTATDLSEATLGTGILTQGQTIDLGPGLWLRSPSEGGNRFEYLDATTGETIAGLLSFTDSDSSNGTGPHAIGDLNFDGEINALDWPIYRNGYRADLTGLSPAQAYGQGDLDGDGANNATDFGIFKTAYLANNPGASFAALVSGEVAIPEPTTFGLLAVAVGLVLCHRCRGLATLALLAALMVPAREAQAVIIVPTLADSSNLDAFGGTGPTQLIDNSGLSVPVNAGVSTSAALDATHAFGGGVAQSYVTNDNGADYFLNSPTQPQFIWDLTGGGNTNLGAILLWNYQNNGGSGTAIGNQSRQIDLRFNTESEGATTFVGAATTVTMVSALALGGTNPAQAFNVGGGSYRYVQMTITDNHAGDPDGQGVNGGGDRVGLGELRFSNTPLPELTLQVNTVTGRVRILGDTNDALTIDLYEVTTNSPAATLNPITWNSLAEQDFEGGGPVNSTGNGWEVLGSPTTTFLGEAFLQGSSAINAGAVIDLGNAYNPAVLGSGVNGNLVFSYRTAGGSLKSGLVSYITTAGGVAGDYNADGTVNAADYTVWRDNLGGTATLPNDSTPGSVTPADYTVWAANFGANGGSLATASVPEPTTVGLVLLGGVVAFARRLRIGRVLPTLVAALALATMANATVSIDRQYLLGDDALEAASQGAVVGSNNSSPLPGGVTADSIGPTGAFLDLTQTGGATYQNVGSTGLARPGAAAGQFGVRFDGVDDQLDGTPLNRPDELETILGVSYPLNYTGITLRGLQMWVYPTASALGSSTSPTAYQSIVFDSIFSGGPAIDSQGRWTQTHSFHSDGSDGIPSVPATVAVVAGNTWYHVMHHNYANGAANAPKLTPASTDIRPYTSVVYVNGIAVSANNDNININGDDAYVGKLVVGAAEIAGDGFSPVYDHQFNGVLDDLQMYVYGNNTSQGGQNYGTFNLFTDNAWIADQIATTVPGGILKAGDVNRDGTVSGTGTGPAASDDITAFIANWRRSKEFVGAHNRITAGDWETWGWGDMNSDGIVNFSDWYILRDNHPNGASLSLAQLLAGASATVPEPAAGLTVCGLLAVLGWLRRRAW